MTKIQIINGPNLNLLGKREPTIYGSHSFEEYLEKLRAAYPMCEISYYQSNCEGQLIDKIQEVGFEYDGIIHRIARRYPLGDDACRRGAYLQRLPARTVPPHFDDLRSLPRNDRRLRPRFLPSGTRIIHC